jgi:hypothetical protein
MCTENAVRAPRVAFKGGKSVSDAVEFRRRLAAAYEVDDFVVVAGLNGGVGPLRAREDFEIAFDGDAGGRQIQVAQQIGYCGALRGFAALSIDNNCVRRFHLSNSTLPILFVAKFATDTCWLGD